MSGLAQTRGASAWPSSIGHEQWIEEPWPFPPGKADLPQNPDMAGPQAATDDLRLWVGSPGLTLTLTTKPESHLQSSLAESLITSSMRSFH